MVKARESVKKYDLLLQNIGSYTKEILSKADKEEEQIKIMLIKEAEAAAAAIAKQSLVRTANEIRKRNREFYREIVEKSVKDAEEMMGKGLRHEDDLKICRSFLAKLSASRPAGS
jgi:F0F1-type ATP synthase membrane subunit b/b'